MLIAVWVTSSPVPSISTRVEITLEGAGKNRVSMKPKRAQSSQTSSKPSGEITFRRRSRVRADMRPALRGPVKIVCTLME